MGAVSLQGGPPGRFCGLTAQGYLGRKGGLAVKSWVVGVVWGLMAQGPLPSLELGGELLPGWLFAALWFWGTRETLTTLHAPSRQLVPLLLGAGPRKATTPTIPGPGRIREMHLLCPAPRSRDLYRPPSQASSPCPSIQAALTEAIDVSAKQLGCVTIPLGTKVTAPLSVQRGSAERA